MINDMMAARDRLDKVVNEQTNYTIIVVFINMILLYCLCIIKKLLSLEAYVILTGYCRPMLY